MTNDLNSIPKLQAVAGFPQDDAVYAEMLSCAPYLARLDRRCSDMRAQYLEHGPEAVFEQVHARIRGLIVPDVDRDHVVRELRRTKEAGHFVIALADLAGDWDVTQVTRHITRLAEALCETALWGAYCHAARLGWVLPCSGPQDCGIVALAMGKMGAYELNYSSDVDLIVLLDPDRVQAGSRSAQDAAVRITQDFVRLMEERTEDGYVFRTDLRLRPDPASNPVALRVQSALNYYERIGQNWERMAFIKARPCCGDIQVGEAFLDELSPFVWRRHLDYWALGDIHAIKRQIHAYGEHEALSHKEFDVKLGRGGIREIEFFVQTQQLILGGRDPNLRLRRTDEALLALEAIDAVSSDDATQLAQAYDYLRALEHRIQMRNDEQTHVLPDKAETRIDIARMSGYRDDIASFEADVSKVRYFVHGAYSNLFGEEERLSGESGNLVFSGVDEDPGTVATLKGMGFSNPANVIDLLRRWHRGGLPATRTSRGQQLLTSLTPSLLQWMSVSGEPDAAFARFAEFVSGLRGGVQVFSLMVAEPAFARDLISVMAFAPRLSKDLARQPALLDGMLDADFHAPLENDAPDRVQKALQAEVDREDDFEDRINAARRFQREELLRIGYQVLQGRAPAAVAGEAYTRLADASIQTMSDTALQEISRRFGDWKGRWVVCGMGKLGGREMSATSDLDIMVIYDPGEPPEISDLPARFTQRLIAALSAPTEEGMLYEVDMRLRPSGKAGPVAVKLASFEQYYAGDAWTWEFMALTRLRVIVGDERLASDVRAVQRAALAKRSGYGELEADILDMRQLMSRERKAKTCWDVKLAPGGLVDVEFIVQQEILKSAGSDPDVIVANTVEAIGRLEALGCLSQVDARVLRDGYRMQVSIQQAMRIALTDDTGLEKTTTGLKSWLARVCGQPDFDALETALLAAQASIADIRLKKIGPLATDTGT